MAIADDFTIDYVDRKITYTGGFTGTIADSRYTVNELYSYLQDTFDEPAQMDDPVPMSAQTPTQYTIINKWFMDDETVKALYSGSIQTSNWTYDGVSQGITQILWDGGTSVPEAADIGVTVTGGSTGATGVILAVDASRLVVWVRNTNAFQFADADTVIGTGVNFTVASDIGAQQGVRSGDSVWANAFSVGTIQSRAEIYLAQETEWHGGAGVPVLDDLASWWNTATDFTGSTNGVKAGHIDVLVKVRDAGIWIDDLGAANSGRIAAYVRQGGTVYSHFEFLGAVGNYVMPFASTGYDINVDGFNRILIATGPTGGDSTLTVGAIIKGGTSGAEAIISATDNSTYVEYFILGKDLTNFTAAGETITEYLNDGTTATGVSFTSTAASPTLVNGAAVSGVTVTFSHAAYDVNQDGNNEYYACTVDCNNNSLADVYQYLMYITRRGSTTNLLPEPGAGFEDGQFYRGVGDVYITCDASSAGSLTDGETVSGSISSATGEVVAYLDDTYLVLCNVKGSFVNNDIITGATSGETATASANQVSLVDVSAAPFGTFAGGRFFVARGVLLTNVPAADNNNWQTSDVEGAAYQPPTTITLTLAGLSWKDRGIVLEVGTNGGIDVVKTAVGVEVGVLGSSSITLDETVQADVPSTGWIRVVDTSVPGKEERYEFSGISGSGVTLRTVSAGTGTATGTDATDQLGRLESTAVSLNFGTDGKAKVGHQIRNLTTGEYGVVLRDVSANVLETTPSISGWTSGDTYEINKIVSAIDVADTCYFPFIDDVCASGATSLSKSLKFAATTEILARARFSDPDIGGTRILPFELLGQTISNSDLTITAIRTTDPIAT